MFLSTIVDGKKKPLKKFTTWKVSGFGAFLVRIFPHSDWIQTNIPYLSVFSSNAGRYGRENLGIWTLFTQWLCVVLKTKTSKKRNVHKTCVVVSNLKKGTSIIIVKRSSQLILRFAQVSWLWYQRRLGI